MNSAQFSQAPCMDTVIGARLFMSCFCDFPWAESQEPGPSVMTRKDWLAIRPDDMSYRSSIVSRSMLRIDIGGLTKNMIVGPGNYRFLYGVHVLHRCFTGAAPVQGDPVSLRLRQCSVSQQWRRRHRQKQLGSTESLTEVALAGCLEPMVRLFS